MASPKPKELVPMKFLVQTSLKLLEKNLAPSTATITNPNFNIDYYKYIAICDGSGNAVGAGIEHGGWGYRIGDEEPVGGTVLNATNNEAEYTSLIECLKELKNRVKEDEPVLILMDSMLVVNQVNGWYRVSKPHLQVLKTQVDALISDVPVSLVWVPREIMVAGGVDHAAYSSRVPSGDR